MASLTDLGKWSRRIMFLTTFNIFLLEFCGPKSTRAQFSARIWVLPMAIRMRSIEWTLWRHTLHSMHFKCCVRAFVCVSVYACGECTCMVDRLCSVLWHSVWEMRIAPQTAATNILHSVDGELQSRHHHHRHYHRRRRRHHCPESSRMNATFAA